MKFKDVREFIAFLEGKGELLRIKTPVSCELEITEITDRVVKREGPALLFENVEGYDMPVLINAYGSAQRTALPSRNAMNSRTSLNFTISALPLHLR